MVAERIMDCAAPASGKGQRQRQPESRSSMTRNRGDSKAVTCAHVIQVTYAHVISGHVRPRHR